MWEGKRVNVNFSSKITGQKKQMCEGKCHDRLAFIPFHANICVYKPYLIRSV